ncbi:MAG: hypothetical protein AAF376_05385 [Pseudomonadota bacterium]
MFWSLLTAFVAAFAGAGVGLALRHLSRKRLPKGVIPVCAGLAMLFATVATEYQWAPNVQRTMAEDLVIVAERQQQAWYQPWTYIQPWTRGFIGYSPSETVETTDNSGILVVQTRIQERWRPEVVLPVLVECDTWRRGEVTPDTEFDDTGQPVGARWIEVAEDDPLLTTVCEGGTANS